MLHASHFRYYRVNMQVERIRSHHTLIKLSCYVKVTVSGFKFGPLPHITVIRQLFKLLDNLCAGTTNHGGTQKSDNPLKGIQNPIPCNLNNPLKGIRDLVQKRNPEPVTKRVNRTNLGLTVVI